MKLGIGIDTGGTCTDAVLYDFETRTVLGKNKALTTPQDLTIGILNALDGLDPALCRQAVLAGLSTTLATNACVEGKFRRTRLLLLGIDRAGVKRFGADYGLTDPDDVRYLPCKTTIDGKVLEEPDWDMLRANAKEWFHDVEAAAVCEVYGVRNGGVLEKKAAQILTEQTGLPVMCASVLFSGLSSLERGASALLNAGLLPVTNHFLDAVKDAFRQRGITCDVMIVRSDSSLMSCEYSAEHAVETLLSGPAASALGGCALTDAEYAVIVDIGGTTTDIALVESRTPVLSDEGIRVGGWRTLVKGLFAASFALGGDSVVRWSLDGMTVGPDRVIPLCVLGTRYPFIEDILRAQIETVPAHTQPLHEFLTLAREDWRNLPLDTRERTLCEALEERPLSVQQASDLLGIECYALNTHTMEKLGVILRAGLTPTDVMHALGDYTQYNRTCSILALRFAAASLDLSPETLCQKIYEHVEREVFYGISRMLLEYSSDYYRNRGIDPGVQELLRLQWEARGTGGNSLLHCLFHSPAKIIGIGGPTHLFLPEAAKALRAECVIPDSASTANAVGAVTGKISVTGTAEVRPHGQSVDTDAKGDYEVLCTGQEPRYFETEEEGVAWASETLAAWTTARVREQGAIGSIAVQTDSKPVIAGAIKLCTLVTVTATTYVSLEKEDAPV